MTFVLLPGEWMDLLNECVAIAYQTVDDEKTAELIKELMIQLEEAEIDKDNGGSGQIVLGGAGRWRLQ